MRSLYLGRLAAIATLFVGVFGSQPSLAQHGSSGDKKAIAESLFRDGRKLLSDNRVADACRKLEESYRLDPAQGTLLNLAMCHEQEGKLATAWAEFNEAMVEARKTGRDKPEAFARERIQALEPLVPHLTVTVPADSKVPDLQVKIRGTPLFAGAWNAAIPVDPGEISVEAQAPGRKAWKSVIIVGKSETKSVSVPQLAVDDTPVAATAAGPSTDSSPGQLSKQSTAPAQPGPYWTTKRQTGLIVAGVGVSGLVVGSIFGIRALSKQSDSDAYCSGKSCRDQRGIDLSDEANSSAWVSNIALGVGVLAVATGAYLFLTGEDQSPASSKEVSSKKSIRVMVGPGPTPSSASVFGTF